MRKNWMDDLAQGVDTGYKLGQMYQDGKMRRELKDANKVNQEQSTGYTPDQIRQLQGDSQAQDGETWDEGQQGFVNQTGGLRKPTNVPTLKDGQYSMDGGKTNINPATQYRLGIQQQDHAFSPDEIAMEKLNRKADIYSNYGKEDMAETMRNSASTRGLQAQQLKLSQSQLEDANIKLGYAKNEAAIMKIGHELTTGAITEDEAMAKLVDATDPMHKDGITHGFKKMGDGTYEVHQMHGNKIMGSQSGVTFDMAFKEAMMYANPQNLKDAQKEKTEQDRFDKNYGLELSKAEVQAVHLIASDKEEARKNDAYIQNLKDRLGLDEKELVLKGIVSKAQAAAYGASAAKDRSVSNAYKNITYDEQGNAVEMFQGKTGGMQVRPVTYEDGKPFKGAPKGTGIKSHDITPDAATKIEALLQNDEQFMNAPPEAKEEMRQTAYEQFGYGSPQQKPDLLSLVSADKGDPLKTRGFAPQVVTGKIRPANK